MTKDDEKIQTDPVLVVMTRQELYTIAEYGILPCDPNLIWEIVDQAIPMVLGELPIWINDRAVARYDSQYRALRTVAERPEFARRVTWFAYNDSDLLAQALEQREADSRDDQGR